MNSPTVTIIVVSWNTKAMLQDCLDSVYANLAGLDCEVIVVDNASVDGSPEMVETRFPQAILVRNADNRGFAAANNQGMQMARGSYVLLLNSDTLVLGDVLRKTVEFADAHPQAAVVGCRVLNGDRTLQRTCFMFPSLFNMLLACTYLYKVWARSRLFGREQMMWWDRDDVREVDVVTGCFMMVRREAIAEVGVFDEQFFMYGEETDWCYRFKRAGWKVLFAPAGEIVHYGGGSSSRIRLAMRLQLSASILLFFQKHHGRLSYGLACMMTSLFYGLRIPFWLAKAAASKSTRESDLATAKTYALGACRSLRGWRGLVFR